jgi:hypothetical protein
MLLQSLTNLRLHMFLVLSCCPSQLYRDCLRLANHVGGRVSVTTQLSTVVCRRASYSFAFRGVIRLMCASLCVYLQSPKGEAMRKMIGLEFRKNATERDAKKIEDLKVSTSNNGIVVRNLCYNHNTSTKYLYHKRIVHKHNALTLELVAHLCFTQYANRQQQCVVYQTTFCMKAVGVMLDCRSVWQSNSQLYSKSLEITLHCNSSSCCTEQSL